MPKAFSLFLIFLGFAIVFAKSVAAIEQEDSGTPREGAEYVTHDPRSGVLREGIDGGDLNRARGGAAVAGSAGSQRYIVEFREMALLPRRGLTGVQLAGVKRSLAEQHQRFQQQTQAIRNARGGRGVAAQAQPPVTFAREYFNVFNGVAMDLTEQEREAVAALPDVAKVHPDREVHATLNVSVPLIKANVLHSTSNVKGNGITIAVIDTGINYNHADLGAGFGEAFKVSGGYDFYNDDADPMDDHGHGTHVAGTAAGDGTVKGVAPLAKLMAIKVLGASGSGSTSDVVAGIEYAVDPDGNPGTDDGADVINLSLGSAGGGPDDPDSLAVDAAVAAGVVCAVAAGNDGPNYDTLGSPGAARKALTVGASNDSDQMASFSSRGEAKVTYAIKPEVTAPGVNIVAASMAGGTESMSGTSMATPHVAGAAALLLEMHPTWTPDQVKSALSTTAIDLGQNAMTQGAGRIDVLKATKAELLFVPSVLSLGKNDTNAAVFTKNVAITVTNTSTTAVSYNLSVDTSEFPAGAFVSGAIDPVVSLNGGQSTTINFSLTVHNTGGDMLPGLPEAPAIYEGMVIAQSGTKVLRLPFALKNEVTDSLEPNNTSATATPFVIESKRKWIKGQGQTKIDPTGTGASDPDEDWFKFSATAGDILFVYCDMARIGSNLAATVRLYNSSLGSLATSSDQDGDQTIQFYPIPATGDYYLHVDGDGLSTGNYNLYANILPPEVSFYWDTFNTASHLTFGNFGDYLYQSHSGNRLTLFDADGPATPIYNVAGGEHWYTDAAENGSLVVAVKPVLGTRETWRYDGTNWEQLDPTPNPGPRYAMGMAYDAAAGRTILFGGSRDREISNETWAFQNGVWTQLSPATSPPARYFTSMVYDSARSRIVMFGGRGASSNNLNDTWEWDGANWIQRFPANAPSARYGHGMAFDSTRNVTVLFGGDISTQTWEYDGTNWTQRSPVTVPSSGFAPAMAYDAARGETVMMKSGNQTWTWNGTNWTLKSPATAPNSYSGAWGMIYDAPRSQIVLVSQTSSYTFGISSPLSETWEWNGTNWTLVTTAAGPARRENFGLAYDIASQKTVLYGGVASLNAYSLQNIEIRQGSNPTPTHILEQGYPNATSGLGVAADGSKFLIMAGEKKLQVYSPTASLIKEIIFSTPRRKINMTRDCRFLVMWDEGATSSYTDDYVVLYDVDNESERFRAPVTLNIATLLPSDDGSRMIFVNGTSARGYNWTGSSYQQTWTYFLDTSDWFDPVAISGDGSIALLAVRHSVGFLDDTGASFFLLNAATGKLIYKYTQTKNPAVSLQFVQDDLKINFDGSLASVSSWGGDRQYPELLVFSPLTNTPLLELGTPGSGMALEVYGNRIAFASRRNHANYFGGGGEMYSLDLSGLIGLIPPFVKDVMPTPVVSPGAIVNLTARVTDADGVASVQATFDSPNGYPAGVIALANDGAHGDGAADDEVWGGSWTTPSGQKDYIVDIAATDNAGNGGVYENMATFTTKPKAFVEATTATLSSGIYLQPGQTHFFSITLLNSGLASAANVNAYAEIQDMHVNFSGGSHTYGTLAPAAIGNSASTAFYVQTKPTVPPGYVLAVDVTITDNAGNTWKDTVDLPPVQPPYIDVTSPVSGGQYGEGSLLPIAWLGANFGGTVDIMLLQDGVEVREIAAGASNTGSYSWPIPVGELLGNNYSVRVRSVETPTLFDLSNGSFSITLPPPNYFTEGFTSNDFDLDNQSLLFIPNGSGDFYSVCRTAAAAFPTDPTGGTVLALGLDDFKPVALTGGKSVSLYGTSFTTVYVASHGYVTFNSGDIEYNDSLTTHFNRRRVSGLFEDIYPGAGGVVSYRQLSDRLAITYENVREYSQLNQNSFQIELFFNGRIRLTYLRVDALNGHVGLSNGGGVPAGFAETNFSQTGVCPIMDLAQAWVQFGFGGQELGTELNPFNTLAEAVQALLPGGTVFVKSGTTATAIKISKAMRIEAVGGAVRLGDSP